MSKINIDALIPREDFEILGNELPRRKQRGILESIERPKGRGIKPELHNKLADIFAFKIKRKGVSKVISRDRASRKPDALISESGFIGQ